MRDVGIGIPGARGRVLVFIMGAVVVLSKFGRPLV